MIAKAFESLNPKQQNFVLGYIKTGEQGLAYARAYNGNDDVTGAVSASASRLLNNAKIKTAIEEKKRELDNPKIADISQILETLTELMNDTKSYPRDRARAADLLLKASGAYIDRQEVKQDTTISVQVGENAKEWAE